MAHTRSDAEDTVEKKRLDQKRINHYLSEKSITEARDLIRKIKKQGQGEDARSISKMDTKLSIPVLLRILLELAGIYNRELAQAAGKQTENLQEIRSSLAVIDDALCIFGETDRVLNLDPVHKTAYLWTLKSKVKHIVGELQKLAVDVQKVEMTKATKPLWEEASLYLLGIYKKTADKIKKVRPCHRVLASIPPSTENFDQLPVHKYNANYIRYSDKLYYLNQDEEIFTKIEMTREKCVQFDVSSPPRALTDKQLKKIASLTQHQVPKSAHLVVMTSPDGQDDMSDLAFLKPKAAYVRRGDGLYYVNKDTKECVKLEFKKDDGLKKFDKELEVESGLRPFTEAELNGIETLTGHSHSLAKVAFREDNGSFDTADVEDSVFKKATGGALTKMDISLYYLQAAKVINHLLSEFDKSNKKTVELRQTAPVQVPNPGKVRGGIPAGKPVIPRAFTIGAVPAKQVKVASSVMPEKEVEPAAVKVVEAVTVVEPAVTESTAPVVEVKPVVHVVAETESVTQTVAVHETPVETVVTAKPVESVIVETPVAVVVEPVVEAVQTVEPVVVEQAADVDSLRQSNEISQSAEEVEGELSVIEPSVVSVVDVEAVAPGVTDLPSAYIESNMRTIEEHGKYIFSVAVEKKDEEFLREISDVINDVLSNPLVDELKKHADSNSAVRLTNFEAALKAHHLTPSQKAALLNFRDDAIEEINKYLNEKNSLFNYVYKAHDKVARDTIAKMNATEDTEDHLNAVLRLHRDVYKGKSITLYGYTTSVLLMALERLCPQDVDLNLSGKTSILADDESSVTLQIEVSSDHKEFLQKIVDIVNDMLNNPLVSLLKKDQFSSNERLRISSFQSALASLRFTFTPVERVMLSTFREDAIAVLEIYQKSSLWPTHYHAAAAAIEHLNEVKDDLREQVITMIRLHREMYAQKSDKLYKGIHELLMNTLQMLCPKPPRQVFEQQNNQTAAKDAVTQCQMK